MHFVFYHKFCGKCRPLESAQLIAGYADSRTTKLYDRGARRFYSKIWRGFDIEPRQETLSVVRENLPAKEHLSSQ
jgi:hypothetical protein